RIIIHAAKLLEVKTGKTLADQAIVIDGDKIVSVGPMVQVQRSTSDRLIDLPNATVLPGLTDAHTHLTGDPRNIGYQSLGISIPRATLTGARNARLTLEAGFTTVRNVGAEGYSDVALRDAINAGDIPGPRMLVSGPALGITGGHCDEDLLPFEYHATAEGVSGGRGFDRARFLHRRCCNRRNEEEWHVPGADPLSGRLVHRARSGESCS